MSVVDHKYFYKLNVFRQRYINSNYLFALDELRSCMGKFAKRTLRSEVKYTDRIAKTVQFEPLGNEQKLYELVDEYLHRDKLYAFASSQRHLSALIFRKRLGSSTFAVASTLRNIVRRMEAEYADGKVRDNHGGLIDELGDLNDEEIEAFEETGAYDDYVIKSAKERAGGPWSYPLEKDIECGTYFYKTERIPHARQYKYADDLTKSCAA